MAAWRRAIELSLGDADVRKLRSIAQSRTEPASQHGRAGQRVAAAGMGGTSLVRPGDQPRVGPLAARGAPPQSVRTLWAPAPCTYATAN
jgi:hypothetical protein